MPTKAISAGLLLTDGENFLGCHSTGNKFYDLPKGAPEPGETPLQACIREVREETGLDIDGDTLIHLGVLPYNRQKDLHLYAMIVPALPDPASLHCSSTFLHPYKQIQLPEVDGYLSIPFADAQVYMTVNMARSIEEARQRLRASRSGG